MQENYNVEDMLKDCSWLDEEDQPMKNYDIRQNVPYHSLLERVLLDEMVEYKGNKDGRLASLRNDRFRMPGHELLQRDLHYNTVLHHFLNSASIESHQHQSK